MICKLGHENQNPATAITAAAALDPTVHFACAVGRAANQPTVWLEENSLV